MHNRYKFLLALPLCGALALAACGTAQKDWTNASTVNTVSSYQAFLDKHPKDEHAQEAQTRIAALQDDAAWKTAQGGNSSDSYQAYLQAEPNGTHTQAARDAMTGFDRANAWKTAQSDGSAAALQAFLQKYPQGAEADQARQKLAAIQSDYRAELGHYHNERAAQRKRSELQSRFSKVLVEIDVVPPDSANREFRVMSGLMDRQDASSACTSLKRDHQPCKVVKSDRGQG
jgi:outer membrane protein assembly factor BamD (BamD/ComL family)